MDCMSMFYILLLYYIADHICVAAWYSIGPMVDPRADTPTLRSLARMNSARGISASTDSDQHQ
jgi:hypothetical protein